MNIQRSSRGRRRLGGVVGAGAPPRRRVRAQQRPQRPGRAGARQEERCRLGRRGGVRSGVVAHRSTRWLVGGISAEAGAFRTRVALASMLLGGGLSSASARRSLGLSVAGALGAAKCITHRSISFIKYGCRKAQTGASVL